jgi:hypothetical protein
MTSRSSTTQRAGSQPKSLLSVISRVTLPIIPHGLLQNLTQSPGVLSSLVWSLMLPKSPSKQLSIMNKQTISLIYAATAQCSRKNLRSRTTRTFALSGMWFLSALQGLFCLLLSRSYS